MRFLAVLASLILFAGTPSFAQWLDSTNKFSDSLHMPVCTTTGDQTRTIVVKGEDGGYFLLWEDTRTAAATKTDIYAQKFDKDGHRLWAVDGVPVATSELYEQFQVNSSADYRRYSIAAPDGATSTQYQNAEMVPDGKGGFFIAYLGMASALRTVARPDPQTAAQRRSTAAQYRCRQPAHIPSASTRRTSMENTPIARSSYWIGRRRRSSR